MRVAAEPHKGQGEAGCVESRDTHSTPSSFEHAVTSRPEGKASKGMMDIWAGKSSMRRKGERTVVLYSTTYYLITKSAPDPQNGGIYRCRVIGRGAARVCPNVTKDSWLSTKNRPKAPVRVDTARRNRDGLQ